MDRKTLEKLILAAEKYMAVRVRNTAYVTRNGMIGPTAIGKEDAAQEAWEAAKEAARAGVSR